MSIILKKKKGLLIPKSNPPNINQILGSLGASSILGSTLNSHKEDLINGMIEEAIQKLIIEKLLLHSTRSIRTLDYFLTFNLVFGEKQIIGA